MPSVDAIEALLPHKRPMALLHRLLEVDSDMARCEAQMERLDLFHDEQGNVPGWVGIELIAQTAGVLMGHHAREEGGTPRMGYLLGTRRFDISMPVFPAGSRVEVVVRKVLQHGGMGQYEGEIFIGGEKIASSVVNTYLPGPEEMATLLGPHATEDAPGTGEE